MYKSKQNLHLYLQTPGSRFLPPTHHFRLHVTFTLKLELHVLPSDWILNYYWYSNLFRTLISSSYYSMASNKFSFPGKNYWLSIFTAQKSVIFITTHFTAGKFTAHENYFYHPPSPSVSCRKLVLFNLLFRYFHWKTKWENQNIFQML
jgi:hypothetical protein